MPFIQPLTPEIIEKRRALRRKILGVPGRIWRKTRDVSGRIWRKTRRGLGWTLAFAFVAHTGLNIYSSVLLNSELAAIRQRGEPLKMSEMAPPAVPDAQNAALIYEEATQALHFSREEKAAFTTRTNQRTPHQQEIIAAALTKNQKSVALTRRAAAMPKCVFPLNYNLSNWATLKFSYYGEMRELARLLSAQAQIEAKHGDRERALGDARALFGMAHHLSNEPTLIGFLVAQAIDTLANQNLAKVLEITPVTLAEARNFQNSLRPTDWTRALQHCFQGERVWGVFAFDAIRQLRPDAPVDINFLLEGYSEPVDGEEVTPPWVYYPLILLWRPVSKLDEVQYLRVWQPQLVAARSPQFPHRSNGDQAVQNFPRYALLSRILYPVFNSVSVFRDAAEVRRRQREIALSLAVYRAANGHYPAQISQIAALNGKTLPLDPYNQKPFGYHRNGKGFTLYSVGLNHVDNGGKGQGLGANFNIDNDDIIWREARF